MSGEEFIIAIIALVMGSVVLIVGISKFAGLIKAWINRNQSSYDDESFSRLARAFTLHKKEMEQRLQNLEAIIAEEDGSPSGKALEQPHETIEIENTREDQKSDTGNSNLKNMLRE